jgi:hypothetical protein
MEIPLGCIQTLRQIQTLPRSESGGSGLGPFLTANPTALASYEKAHLYGGLFHRSIKCST